MREKIMRAGHLEVALRRAKACAAGFFVASVGMHSSAAEAPWKFDPPKVGHALSEGGWSVGYEIGSVSASPEFTFPIQLVYLNGRTERGVFGGGWICPQLDTRVIPRESGIFVWQMPSGGMMGFRQDRKDGRIYRGLSGGGWQATVAGPAQEIWNEEGWRFRYERSRPVSIISPGGRSLIFIWKAKRLVELRLSAGAPGPAASAPGLTVLRAAYSDGDDRLRGLEIQGQVSRFDHAAGKDGPVTAWTPPVGARVVFGYSKAGQLASTQMEKGDREDFRTAFFVSGKGERADRSRLANWWLVQDRNFAYAYGKNKKGFPQPTLVTITDRAGRSRSLARLDGGMQVAESVDGVERATYFYRAPGQKYDGKLRMIKEGEKTLAEYRYDRKSGLLTESIDEHGVITFFDYPPGALAGTFVPGHEAMMSNCRGGVLLIRMGFQMELMEVYMRPSLHVSLIPLAFGK